MTLDDSWRRTWTELGAEPPLELRQELRGCYAESHRAYHTLQHLEECLALFQTVRAEAEQPAQIDIALWFHDAIYAPRASDNEERSAEWAHREVERRVGRDPAARVRSLILATKHDVELSGNDEQLVVDVDLHILGVDEDRFDEYEKQVRREYRWVPGPLYRRKRREILQGFADRDRILGIPQLYERFESRARENLKRSIARLG